VQSHIKTCTNGTASNLKAYAQQRKQSLDLRDSLQNGRKIFVSYTSDKGLIIRIHRELKKPLASQKINNPMKK
jgi:hypothetical protein